MSEENPGAESEAVRAFRHPVEIMEPSAQAGLVEQLADVLTPVFLYLSKGRLTGTMEVRAWVVLREVRADLVQGESVAKAAARLGVSDRRVQELVEEFRAQIPAYHSTTRRGRRVAKPQRRAA